MRSLEATGISSEVSETLEPGVQGSVHSVFHRALNIIIGEFLVALADRNLGEIPNGVLLKQNPDLHFDRLGLYPGMVVYYYGSRLDIPDAGLSINLAAAKAYLARRTLPVPILPMKAWKPRLVEAIACGRILAPAEGLGPLWDRIDEVVNAGAVQSDVDSPKKRVFPTIWEIASSAKHVPRDEGNASSQRHIRLLGAATESISDLLAGMRDKDLSLVDKGVSSLSGLGIGLTPSGDDVLTGFLAAVVLSAEALHPGSSVVEKSTTNKAKSQAKRGGRGYVSHPGEDPWQQRLVEKVLESSAGRSNLIAQSYLRHASKGEVSDSLASYIAALVSESGTDIESATRRLFSYGETSGCELAIGAYVGVSYWF